MRPLTEIAMVKHFTLQTITGTNGPDNITVHGGAAEVFALGGDDTVKGGSGDDIIHGGDGNDHLYGGGGNDQLFADGFDASSFTGADTLEGGAGNDLLVGNAGVNYLIGGSGNDTIIGNGGPDGTTADIETGGGGADTFVFQTAAMSTHYANVVITDFSPTEGDLIDLSGFHPTSVSWSEIGGETLVVADGGFELTLDATGLNLTMADFIV